jgi:hypothetical protein
VVHAIQRIIAERRDVHPLGSDHRQEMRVRTDTEKTVKFTVDPMDCIRHQSQRGSCDAANQLLVSLN